MREEQCLSSWKRDANPEGINNAPSNSHYIGHLIRLRGPVTSEDRARHPPTS